MPNRHHSHSFHARPPTAMPSGRQVQSHHQTRVQSAVGQAHEQQGTGGLCRNQMPFNPHHGAYPVNDTTVYPPHRGGPRSFHPGHNVC